MRVSIAVKPRGYSTFTLPSRRCSWRTSRGVALPMAWHTWGMQWSRILNWRQKLIASSTLTFRVSPHLPRAGLGVPLPSRRPEILVWIIMYLSSMKRLLCYMHSEMVVANGLYFCRWTDVSDIRINEPHSEPRVNWIIASDVPPPSDKFRRETA